MKCDGVGCAVKRGVQIALPLRLEALAEDCARARVLISAVMTTCQGPDVLIDQDGARKGQGWRITLSPLRADSVRDSRGDRPWVARSQPSP